MASLQANLGGGAPFSPCLQFPARGTTARSASKRSVGCVVPAVGACRGQESRLFCDWPIPANVSAVVFAEFRRGFAGSPQPPLPPAESHRPRRWAGGLAPGLAAAAAANPNAPSPAHAIHAAPSPSAAMKATALARLQALTCCDSTGLFATTKASRNELVWARRFSLRSSPPSWRSGCALGAADLLQELPQFQASHGRCMRALEWMKQEIAWREFFHSGRKQRHGRPSMPPGGHFQAATTPGGTPPPKRFRRGRLAQSGHPLD